MKIVHLCLCGPVTDGWNYQDNILPKYHKFLGHNTTVITSEFIWGNDGEIKLDNREKYINEFGVQIIRLKCSAKSLNSKFKRFYGLVEILKNEKPNIIFIHGCQFLDMKFVVKYLKENPHVKVYVDNHADFSNSATNWVSKNILHKIIWRRCAKMIEPYTTKFYGVLPARVGFLVDVYNLPKEKVELLVMGADDEEVEKVQHKETIEFVRKENGINEDEFFIVTGGKIDLFKPQTLLLMEAVNRIPNAKLLVFGSIAPELKEKFEKLCSDKVRYIGWISADESYKYFAAADLVAFPGRHSVFWEEVAALGKPMIVKYWDGTTHIDMDGNVRFLYKDSVDEIAEEIQYAIKHIQDMKECAKKNAKEFLYSDIARRSIEE